MPGYFCNETAIDCLVIGLLRSGDSPVASYDVNCHRHILHFSCASSPRVDDDDLSVDTDGVVLTDCDASLTSSNGHFNLSYPPTIALYMYIASMNNDTTKGKRKVMVDTAP